MENKNVEVKTKESRKKIAKEPTSPLWEHAKRELDLTGMFKSEVEWDKKIANSVLELIKVFLEQEHTGFSAITTLMLFNKLVKFENLTPITSNPEEWMEVGPNIWQNKRNPVYFSHDQGKTFYDINTVFDKQEENNLISKIKKFLSSFFK